MNTRIIAAAMLFASLAICAFGQPVQQIAVPDSTGYIRPISSANPLPAAVTITTDSSGIVDAVKQCSEWAEQVVSLTANTAATFTTEISGSRRFVELTAQNPDIQFWISLSGTAAVAGCRPVNGSIYLEIPKSVVVSMIASQAVKISVVEGGY